MERVVDSIGGRGVAVVYGAEQIELPRNAGRWARSRQLRRLAKRYGASHLLKGDDARGEHETWWFGRPGVSFAAAIEAWAAAQEDVDDDVVLVPLDDRIYAAELDGGEVDGEMVIGEALLPEQFQRWRGRTVRAFEGGELGYVVQDTAAALEPLPFDLRAMAYRPAPVALSAAGLFAPAQAVLVAVLAGAVVGGQFYAGWREAAAGGGEEALREAEARALALQGDFSAAAALRGFAELVWEDSSLVLHRGGLQKAAFAGGWEVVLVGESAGRYPRGAERYAAAHGAGLVVSGESWQVTRYVGWSAPTMGSVEEFRGRKLAENLYGAAGFPRARVSGGTAVPSGETEERSFAIRIEAPTRRDFEVLAEGLKGLPYRATSASCEFKDYLATACELWIVGKGVSE